MQQQRKWWPVILGSLGVLIGLAWLYRSTAQDRTPSEKKEPADVKDEIPEAAVRKTAAAFVKAFNQGDAKGVAALWTKDAEYIGADGETVQGRNAIEKEYAILFKKNPKATADVQITSIRLLGRTAAMEEGVFKIQLASESPAESSRYVALHVREDDGWRIASVREWVPDASELITLKDVDWLVGNWEASAEGNKSSMKYTLDENKKYLRGSYRVTRDDKVVSSGTQIITKDPNGGLRSWQFDDNGGFGEWTWAREGERWVIDAGGTLPNGSTLTSVNILIPLGKDAFTWQSIERTADGTPLPNTPPVKTTRVK